MKNTKTSNYKISLDGNLKRLNSSKSSLASLLDASLALFNIDLSETSKYILLLEEQNNLVTITDDNYDSLFEQDGKTFKIILRKKQLANIFDVSVSDRQIEDYLNNMSVTESIILPQSQYNFNVPSEHVVVDEQPLPVPKTKMFFHQCAFCGVYPIKDCLYFCLLCRNCSLCSACEPAHQHPLFKIKSTEFSKIQELGMVIADCVAKKQGLFEDLKDIQKDPLELFLGKQFNCKITVKNETVELKPQQTGEVTIELTNTGRSALPVGTVIFAENTQELKVESFKLDVPLEPKLTRSIKLRLAAALKETHYFLNFKASHTDNKINTTSSALKVVIDRGDPVELLDNCERYKKLPKDRQEMLQNIMCNEISLLPLDAVYEILDRHNWNLDTAVDELTK